MYSVASYDISLILCSAAALFRQQFKLIFMNCVLFHYLIAVRTKKKIYIGLSSHTWVRHFYCHVINGSPTI